MTSFFLLHLFIELHPANELPLFSRKKEKYYSLSSFPISEFGMHTATETINELNDYGIHSQRGCWEREKIIEFRKTSEGKEV